MIPLKSLVAILLLSASTVCLAQIKEEVTYSFDKTGTRKTGGKTDPKEGKPEFFIGKDKDRYETKFERKNSVLSVKTGERIVISLFNSESTKDPVFAADNINRTGEITFTKGTGDDETFSGLSWAASAKGIGYMYYVFAIKRDSFVISAVRFKPRLPSDSLRVIVPPTRSTKILVNGTNTITASRISGVWYYSINGDTVFIGKDIITPEFESTYSLEVYAEGKSTNLISAFKFSGYSAIKPKPVANLYHGTRPFDIYEFRKRLTEKYMGTLLSFNEGIMVVRGYNGKYGAVDSNGLEVLPPKYQTLSGFYYGLAPATLDSLRGYIDMKGNFVIKLDGYAYCQTFSEGYAVVSKIDGGPYAYIDVDGKFMTGFVYEKAREFEGGKAKVKKDGREFFLNLQFQEVP